MGGSNRQQHRMREGRNITALPELELLIEIAGEIVVPGKLDGRAEGRKRLHENFTRGVSPAGAAGNLREELKRPLARPEIRQMEREISVDNSDERDVRKVQAFGDHLRADQNIDLAAAKGAQSVAERVLPRHGIGIHPPNDRVRKELRDVRLHLLRAEAGIDEGVFLTRRTSLRYRGGVPAEMTVQAGRGAMKRKRNAAVRALPRLAARAAEQRSGEATAVQEQDRLLAFLEPRRDRAVEFLAQDGERLRFPLFLAEVDDADERHLVVV